MLRVGYRRLATHLVKQAGFIRKTAQAGSVTFIQRLGSALNLNIHFHMLFLNGVFTEQADGSLRFHPTKAPSAAELTKLAHTLAFRIGRYLERQGLLERDAENSYLVGDEFDAGPLAQLQSALITYRVTAGLPPSRAPPQTSSFD